VRSVRFHPAARVEFLHEVQYYAAISPRLAERFERAVHAAETSAAEAPEAWPKYAQMTRRVVDRTFKFSLVYMYTEADVYVVAIAPNRRKPGYWKARLSDTSPLG
jgi:toxin ParE1/3/4